RLQSAVSERECDSSITQALHIINGDTVNRKLRAPDGTVNMLLKLGLSDQQIVDYLFLAALSRYPAEAERYEILSGLQQAKVTDHRSPEEPEPVGLRRDAVADLAWAILKSKQFMFNH